MADNQPPTVPANNVNGNPAVDALKASEVRAFCVFRRCISVFFDVWQPANLATSHSPLATPVLPQSSQLTIQL
jgi:hypothetical protein